MSGVRLPGWVQKITPMKKHPLHNELKYIQKKYKFVSISNLQHDGCPVVEVGMSGKSSQGRIFICNDKKGLDELKEYLKSN
jgi:hypothetical protein